MSLDGLRRSLDMACRLSDRHLRRYVGLRQAVEALCDQADGRRTLPGYVLTADLRATLARLDAEHARRK